MLITATALPMLIAAAICQIQVFPTSHLFITLAQSDRVNWQLQVWTVMLRIQVSMLLCFTAQEKM